MHTHPTEVTATGVAPGEAPVMPGSGHSTRGPSPSPCPRAPCPLPGCGVDSWVRPAAGTRSGRHGGKAAPTSSSCSSWDALLPRGAGGAAPPAGGGSETPSSSTTRAGAHAAGGRVPKAPPGGGGGGGWREKPPGSPSSDRVSEPEEDSAEEAPGEDAAAAARAGVQAPWPLQPRGTRSIASETFSPISLSGPKCDPRGGGGPSRAQRLRGKPQAARLRLALTVAPGLRGAPRAATWPRPGRQSPSPS